MASSNFQVAPWISYNGIILGFNNQNTCMEQWFEKKLHAFTSCQTLFCRCTFTARGMYGRLGFTLFDRQIYIESYLHAR